MLHFCCIWGSQHTKCFFCLATRKSSMYGKPTEVSWISPSSLIHLTQPFQKHFHICLFRSCLCILMETFWRTDMYVQMCFGLLEAWLYFNTFLYKLMFAFYILSYILGREDQICLHLKAFKFFLYFTSLFLHILLFLTCVFKRDIVSAWRHVQLCSGAADRISEFAPHYTMSYSYTQLQNTGGKYKIQKMQKY